jgi:8-oxo-dGTP pyrophosphatase MutT (NUDIX family)
LAAPLFDPLTLPVDCVSADPALLPDVITPAALRAAFLAPGPWQPEPVVEPRVRAGNTAPVPAAVLIGLVMRAEGLTVLLTERTAHLHDHAGQVSFPGGRVEPEDDGAKATALRETEEEIGLRADYIEIIGALPEYTTGTGFRVTPVVGLVAPGFELKPDPFEVANVFEVPLAFLMDPKHHETRRATVGDVVRSFYTMPYREHFIWGATAAMLRNLYRFLAAQILIH